jgi:hypothetical protein
MGGVVGVYSSPKACQQKGPHMWYCGTTRGLSCIPVRVIWEHGELSLHAKWAGLIVKVPLMFSYCTPETATAEVWLEHAVLSQ